MFTLTAVTGDMALQSQRMEFEAELSGVHRKHLVLETVLQQSRIHSFKRLMNIILRIKLYTPGTKTHHPFSKKKKNVHNPLSKVTRAVGRSPRACLVCKQLWRKARGTKLQAGAAVFSSFPSAYEVSSLGDQGHLTGGQCFLFAKHVIRWCHAAQKWQGSLLYWRFFPGQASF